MKNNITYAIYFLLLTSTVLSGCSLTDVKGTGGRTSSQEDLQAVRQILGESLSSDDSGIVLSLTDALTTISNSSFIPQKNRSALSTTGNERSGRGKETNYIYSYHQQSGIHAVSFQRRLNDPLFSKSVSDSLHYNFQNSSGNNIQFPRENAANVKTIYFDGRREGQISGLRQQSTFVRQDTFIINDVNSQTLSINGVHHGKGTIQITPSNQPSFERSYHLEINLLNISAPPSAFNSSQSIWRDISGTLSWQLSIKNSPNGTAGKSMGGTIKLTGAGIALLKLQGKPTQFQVNLNNGDVKDREKEFEGQVTSIDLTNRSIRLHNDRTLYLNDSTEIDEDDYPSLQAAQQALDKGTTVWAEGEGFLDGDRFIISEIEFESDEDGEMEDQEEIEFDEVLSSVNIAAGTFTLANKVTIGVEDSSVINDDGDFFTLQAVSDAIADGQTVTADGEGYPATEDNMVDITATSVKFERVEQDNNGEED